MSGNTLRIEIDTVSPNNQNNSNSWFPVNWHFNVLEMTLTTLHFVQGLSRTPLLFVPRYLTTRFPKNCFFDNSGWNWGGLEVSRVTAPSIRSYMQMFCRFGLTWHRKVNFSTFSGKLTCQSTRNVPQNLPFCPGSLQDTFIIYSSISHQHMFRNYFAKQKIHNWKSEDIKSRSWKVSWFVFSQRWTNNGRSLTDNLTGTGTNRINTNEYDSNRICTNCLGHLFNLFICCIHIYIYIYRYTYIYS